MRGLDGLFKELPTADQSRVVSDTIHDIWQQRVNSRQKLVELLERVGWGVTGSTAHPLELQVAIEISALPEDERKLLSQLLT